MKSNSDFRDFKPAIRFLLIFVLVYIVGNTLYGLYVEYYKPVPDPATVWVTRQTAFVLRLLKEPAFVSSADNGPNVAMKNDVKTVLSVFEGCNGINIMIVFASFILAFGGRTKLIFQFLGAGFLILHVANILRIMLLFYTALYQPLFFYYFHKYLFTAVLYMVVLALWLQWTRMKPQKSVTAEA